MKNVLKAKAISRIAGFFVLIALIGFSMVACDDDSGPGDVAVTGVTLNKSSLPLVVGGSSTLTATVAPSNATNKAVTWSSTNASIASVNNGTVTAVAAGSATITVNTVDGGKTATCSVTVTGGGDNMTFTSVAEFGSWFKSQPANSASSPYNVKLNVSSLSDIGTALWLNNRYVNLDLSGSTFTSIASSTFRDCTALAGVTISNRVTSIEYQAFRNTSLSSVTIPANVTSIALSAFRDCASLTSVTFQRADTTIANTNSFPGGSSLQTAYKAGGKGTYTRSGAGTSASPYTWAKQ
jgi:hypothetical protein